MISMGRTGLVAVLIVTGAYCTKSQAADSVVGSWRLVSWVFVEVKDDQLIIKTPPIISPISGKESVSTLVWERVK